MSKIPDADLVPAVLGRRVRRIRDGLEANVRAVDDESDRLGRPLLVTWDGRWLASGCEYADDDSPNPATGARPA